ncbi:MAG: hypothetical protein AAFU79_09040 [Myxococcota bacterium]
MVSARGLGACIGCAVAAAVAGGCRTVPSLKPAPSARVAPEDARGSLGENAVMDTAAGIQVVATTEGWNGPVTVPTYVTAMKLAVRNTSKRPVRLEYKHLRLEAPKAGETKTFKAVPPHRIRSGAVNQLTDPYGSVRPLWFGRGYSICGPYAGFYRFPNSPWAGPYPLVLNAWNRPFLATRYVYAHPLLAYGLPPGILEPGGEVEGWVFFRRVDADLPRLTLRAELVDADTKKVLGAARIPFDNERLMTEGLPVRSSEPGGARIP